MRFKISAVLVGSDQAFVEVVIKVHSVVMDRVFFMVRDLVFFRALSFMDWYLLVVLYL